MLKGKTPLLLSLALGLAAGVIAYSAIQHKIRVATSGYAPVPMIVAAQDLTEGTVIAYEHLSQRPVPEMYQSSSFIRPESAQYLIGQRILVPVQTGDPLAWTQFEVTRQSEHLANAVSKRGRATTITVSDRSSVAGLVRPTDHVDVVGTFRAPDTGEPMALTLLENVIVLATGKTTGTTNPAFVPESQRAYSTVSLFVMPEEVEILNLAAELGQLSLSLRNPEDIAMDAPSGQTTFRTLMNRERRNAIREVRSGLDPVIIRGTKIQREKPGSADR